MIELTPTSPTAPAPGDGASEEERTRRGLRRRVREAAAEHRRLPGEFDLAAELGCSRVQLRQALADLDRMHVVRRRQGAATVVDQVGLRLNVRLEEQFEHAELLARLGYEVRVEILGHAPVA